MKKIIAFFISIVFILLTQLEQLTFFGKIFFIIISFVSILYVYDFLLKKRDRDMPIAIMISVVIFLIGIGTYSFKYHYHSVNQIRLLFIAYGCYIPFFIEVIILSIFPIKRSKRTWLDL